LEFDAMTIRSLDIRPSVRPDPLLLRQKIPAKPAVWLLDIAPERRLALHMLDAGAKSSRPKPPKRRYRLLHYLGWACLVPSAAALAMIAALKILMWGLR
jgi:hypothetical protein